MHENPSDEELKALLTHAKTIAVVGASSNQERPVYGIMRRLLHVGYTVIPINPQEDEILGQKAYKSLSDVPVHIDIVDVFRRADATPPIAEEAVKVKAGALWLQQGIHSEEAAQIAKDGGLVAVTDMCIAVVHSMLGVKNR